MSRGVAAFQHRRGFLRGDFLNIFLRFCDQFFESSVFCHQTETIRRFRRFPQISWDLQIIQDRKPKLLQSILQNLKFCLKFFVYS